MHVALLVSAYFQDAAPLTYMAGRSRGRLSCRASDYVMQRDAGTISCRASDLNFPRERCVVGEDVQVSSASQSENRCPGGVIFTNNVAACLAVPLLSGRGEISTNPSRSQKLEVELSLHPAQLAWIRQIKDEA